MCNIAGYIGTHRAAPILIEMLRAQEGLNAGFYTGIATLHEGRIYYRKLVGNLDDLLTKTDAATLPGSIGVIHSRTPGVADYEGAERAHPFVTERNGEVVAAMVLNGTTGIFAPHKAQRVEIATRLLEHGATFRSRCEGTASLALPDGSCLHGSDVFCQLTDWHAEAGLPLHAATAKTFFELPTEAVILMLSLRRTDAITYARLNFPMHVAHSAHGTYLSTTPQAMPQDAGDYHLLPTLSSGYVYRDHFESYPFPEKPATVAPLSPARLARIREIVCEQLQAGEQTIQTLAGAVRHVFDGYDCGQVGAALYQVLYELEREGHLLRERRYIKGQQEGLLAPIDYMKL